MREMTSFLLESPHFPTLVHISATEKGAIVLQGLISVGLILGYGSLQGPEDSACQGLYLCVLLQVLIRAVGGWFIPCDVRSVGNMGVIQIRKIQSQEWKEIGEECMS